MSDQFDAWGTSEPSRPRGRNNRTTGMVVFAAVMAMIVCLLGVVAAWSFGVGQRISDVNAQATRIYETETAPEPREISATANAYATVTARVEDMRASQDDLIATAQAQGFTPLPEWQLQVYETFDRPIVSWGAGTGHTQHYDRYYHREFKDGRLSLYMGRGDPQTVWRTRVPDIPKTHDGLIMVDARHTLSEVSSALGLAFRGGETGYYFFWVSKLYWGLARVEPPAYTMQPITEDALGGNSTPTKQLAVLMDGDQIDLYINGTLVYFFDDTLTGADETSNIWLTVHFPHETDSRVAFDNLVIFSP